MSTQFALDLVRQNILSAEQCLMVIEAQIDRQIRFGALAIRENLMTMKQVAEVLEAQSCDTSQRQFGELAVEMGFLNDAAIDQLSVAQIKTRPKMRQLLVELGVFNESEVHALYRNFQRKSVSTRRHSTAPRRPKFRSNFTPKSSATTQLG